VARTPRLLVVSAVPPVLFVVLFRYVFGGAIHTSGGNYADYLLPTILILTQLLGATTAVALATDLAGGMVDRFRSLPIARSATLAGRTIADLARATLVLLVGLAAGVAVGFRFHNGFLPGVAGLALVLAFSYAMSGARPDPRWPHRSLPVAVSGLDRRHPRCLRHARHRRVPQGMTSGRGGGRMRRPRGACRRLPGCRPGWW
jgi:ABC-2 type transporter